MGKEIRREGGQKGMLYSGENGRITCPELRCAGMTAYYSGMTEDLNGHPMRPVGPRDLVEFRRAGLALRCETCGRSLNGEPTRASRRTLEQVRDRDIARFLSMYGGRS